MADKTTLDVSTQNLHASTEAHGGHSDEPLSLFKLDPGVGIWALVVFAILLYLLKKFAWGPIISSIDEREKSIRDSLDKAKQAQNESKRIANEQNEILGESKSEAAKILKQAKDTAESLAKKIKQEAQYEKDKILESGLKEIEAAKINAIESLKKETADLAIFLAEKLVQESMNEEKHKIYIDKLIEEINIK